GSNTNASSLSCAFYHSVKHFKNLDSLLGRNRTRCLGFYRASKLIVEIGVITLRCTYSFYSISSAQLTPPVVGFIAPRITFSCRALPFLDGFGLHITKIGDIRTMFANEANLTRYQPIYLARRNRGYSTRTMLNDDAKALICESFGTFDKTEMSSYFTYRSHQHQCLINHMGS